jgi:hypothetical protein
VITRTPNRKGTMSSSATCTPRVLDRELESGRSWSRRLALSGLVGGAGRAEGTLSPFRSKNAI